MKNNEDGDSFGCYIRNNLGNETLRKMFYNYFGVRDGALPRDDKECKKEIEGGMTVYFEYTKARENREEVEKRRRQEFKRQYMMGETETRVAIRGLRDVQTRFVDMQVTSKIEDALHDEIRRGIAALTVAAETFKEQGDIILD